MSKVPLDIVQVHLAHQLIRYDLKSLTAGKIRLRARRLALAEQLHTTHWITTCKEDV